VFQIHFILTVILENFVFLTVFLLLSSTTIIFSSSSPSPSVPVSLLSTLQPSDLLSQYLHPIKHFHYYLPILPTLLSPQPPIHTKFLHLLPRVQLQYHSRYSCNNFLHLTLLYFISHANSYSCPQSHPSHLPHTIIPISITTFSL